MLYCFPFIVFWSLKLIQMSLMLFLSFFYSYTSHKSEGLWPIGFSASSRWSSWEDKIFVTFDSCTPSSKMRTILLGLCVLGLGLSLESLSLNGQSIWTVDRQGAETVLRGEKLLKRVRRGWMWNQFFLQEEYTGSDYQYIGKVRVASQFADS